MGTFACRSYGRCQPKSQHENPSETEPVPDPGRCFKVVTLIHQAADTDPEPGTAARHARNGKTAILRKDPCRDLRQAARHREPVFELSRSPVVALFFSSKMNRAHGEAKERLKEEHGLQSVQGSQPESVATQMVGDFVAEQCTELSLIQLVKRASRHADLSAPAEAQRDR